MAGTRDGGLKGKDFDRELGRKGGRNGHTGGFADTRPGKDGLTGQQRAVYYGRIGGSISRRGKAKKTTEGNENVQD